MFNFVYPGKVYKLDFFIKSVYHAMLSIFSVQHEAFVSMNDILSTPHSDVFISTCIGKKDNIRSNGEIWNVQAMYDILVISGLKHAAPERV